jgi:hypothetical protein
MEYMITLMVTVNESFISRHITPLLNYYFPYNLCAMIARKLTLIIITLLLA